MPSNDIDEGARELSLSRARTSRIDLSEEWFTWGLYEAIGTALGLDPEVSEIPIDDQIDPEAIGALFTSTDGETYVSFPLWDARVTVRSDGLVRVEPDHD